MQVLRNRSTPCFCGFAVSGILIVLALSTLAQFEIGEIWRQHNDRGNRYEGRIEIDVDAPDLELLSFVGFYEPFEEDSILRVKFFLPRPTGVSIQARELLDQEYYWMESKPEGWRPGRWNEFGPWPTRDILDREGVESWNLGVAIWLEEGSGSELTPAFVYHSRPPTSVAGYTIYLRSNRTLKGLDYTLYRIVDGREVEETASSLSGNLIAGEPFAVKLDAEGWAAGLRRLVVEGSYKNLEGGPFREFRFYHQPDLHARSSPESD